MSMIYCEYCDRNIDTDFDATHCIVDDTTFVCNLSDDSQPEGDFSGAGGLDDERYGR